MLRRGTWLLAVVVLLALAPSAAADPGQTTQGTVTSGGADYPYLLYTPTSYRPGRAAPLLVMVHGCETTAEQQMKANLYNPIAEREGFVVLYPDVDATGRAQPGPTEDCWKFPDPQAWTRDSSDAGAIADMTRAVMRARAIDPERVYLIGMSAGGFMASIEAAAYPDLYAAVGISAAGAYADAGCTGTGTGMPVELSSQMAFDQMGPRARVMPRFVIGGDADQGIPPACADKALEQGLRTDNLVIGGSQDGPIALKPASVQPEQKPAGRAYWIKTYRDPSGCVIGERWLIHGMNHFWSGGTTDPKYKSFTDPTGPSAAEASWAFFRRYRKSDTAMPCAEAPATAPALAPKRCAARWLTVRVPAGTRRIRATVGGRRAAVRVAHGRVRVRIPATGRARSKVVIRGRTRAGRAITRRATRRC